MRGGLAALLTEAGFSLVGQAADGVEALDVVRRERPDVVMLDIRMPPTFTDEGLRVAQQLRVEHPDIGILVLSQYVDTAYAVRLMSAGAKGIGYLVKDRVSDLGELTEAVHRVGAGGTVVDPEIVTRLMDRRREDHWWDHLSDRQHEVLALMAEGRSNRAIAERLYLSEKTVEAHVRSIFTRLGLMPSNDDHRRVLAVLSYLRAPHPPAIDGQEGGVRVGA